MEENSLINYVLGINELIQLCFLFPDCFCVWEEAVEFCKTNEFSLREYAKLRNKDVCIILILHYGCTMYIHVLSQYSHLFYLSDVHISIIVKNHKM